MTLKKLKGRLGLPCWKFDERDAGGTRIRKTFYNETEALRFEADFRERKIRNITEPTRRRFQEAAESYLRERRDFRTFSHMKRYTLCLLERFGNRWLDDITILDIGRYRDRLRERYSVYRANRELEVLSAILHHAEENQWIVRAPKVKKVAGEVPRERYLKPEEIQRLFRHEEKPAKRLLLGILLFTGMRMGDVISLEWEHVNLEKGLILNRNSKATHLRKGKPRSQRWIPIAKPLHELFLCVPRWTKWVFPSPSGKSHISNIHKWWHTLRDRAGISDVRIHDMRHTAATYLAMATGSTLTGQRILGHHTSKMAEQYAHPDHHWLKTGVDGAASLMVAAGQGDGQPQKGDEPMGPKGFGY